jgi:NAD dependent epimerase/dehydratase family enzyme
VLASTRAVPLALKDAGFRFQHPRLETALAAML